MVVAVGPGTTKVASSAQGNSNGDLSIGTTNTFRLGNAVEAQQPPALFAGLSGVQLIVAQAAEARRLQQQLAQLPIIDLAAIIKLSVNAHEVATQQQELYSKGKVPSPVWINCLAPNLQLAAELKQVSSGNTRMHLTPEFANCICEALALQLATFSADTWRELKDCGVGLSGVSKSLNQLAQIFQERLQAIGTVCPEEVELKDYKRSLKQVAAKVCAHTLALSMLPVGASALHVLE